MVIFLGILLAMFFAATAACLGIIGFTVYVIMEIRQHGLAPGTTAKLIKRGALF